MSIAQQLGRINATVEMNTKAREFVNLARVLMLARDDGFVAKELLHKHRVLLGPRVKAVFEGSTKAYNLTPMQKAAVSAGTTADASFALPLAEYDTLASAFLESLRNYGAFDRLLPSMRRVPFRTRIGASTSAVTGSSGVQLQVKPVSKLSLTATQIDELKAAAILVVTAELARFSGTTAGDLFAVELSNAVAVATDERFVSELTSGATSNGSSGVTAEHVRNDLRGMLAAITTSARSQLFLLMTSSTAKSLCVMHDSTGGPAFPAMRFNGGEIGGIPVVVSDGVSANTMLLVDATQVAAASDTIRLDSSKDATVQLDTAPDSPPTGSTSMQSLWQLNMVGLIAERFIGVEKLTTTGVCVLTGLAYVGDSPGP